jgi:hypothetical protein|tara:strand:- start:710 stop:1126 length:417 start_codon:yes stop_codon:yes gene_type:complete
MQVVAKILSDQPQIVSCFVNGNMYGSTELSVGTNHFVCDIEEYNPDNYLNYFCIFNRGKVSLQNISINSLDFDIVCGPNKDSIWSLCNTKIFATQGQEIFDPPVQGNTLVEAGVISLKYSWPIEEWFYGEYQCIMNLN